MLRPLVPKLLWAAILLIAVSAPARAQYFGQNKVQYRTFAFQILKTEHFDIYYYEEEAAAAAEVARMAERWYDRLARSLRHELHGRQVLVLYASHPHFQQTNVVTGEIGEGTGGVTEAFKRRIVLPLAGPLAETDHVVGHELVHAFQYDMTGSTGAGIGITGPALSRLPLWFIEGMAEYLSVGHDDPHTSMWIRDAARRDRVPSIRGLEDPRFFPYRFGQAFWAFLAGRNGDSVVPQLLLAAAQTGDVEGALQNVLGIGADSLSREWRARVGEWMRPVIARTDSVPEGKRLSRPGDGRLHLGPALSPDGTRMAFLSERDLFSIELFLANAKTGEILQRVTKTALDPHVQSLQFIQSAGAWSADGTRLAVAAIAEGEPVLHVVRATDGKRLRALKLPGLGEALHPTWDPTGQRIAFTGIVGGLADLFVVDVRSGAVERLTEDAFADLEPAWSPDGSTLAFVTDRFTSTLETLRFGEYRLAYFDVASRTIRPGPGFSRGKNINPQWAPDGASLYFIANPDGIANVYRAAREAAIDATSEKLTNLTTGASGITQLSPALSVARTTGEVLYSVFDRGGYQLYSFTPRAVGAPAPSLAANPVSPAADSTAHSAADTTVRATPVAADSTAQPAGSVLPERASTASASRLAAYPDAGRLPQGAPDSLWWATRVDSLKIVDTPDTLADPETFRRARYSPKLSLDYISQPYLAFGAASSGLYAGAGAALYWSDMLGEHNLGTSLQIQGQGGPIWNNIGGAITYQNRRSRWNWGIGGGQIPYVTREIAVDSGTYEGEPAVRERELTRWEVHRVFETGVSFPFNRVRRLELTGGYRNVDYSAELKTSIFSDITGDLLLEETTSGPDDSLSSLNMGTASVALVYDNAYFGGTSPLLGQRYRLEVGPTFGNLRYLSVLADYRRYHPIRFPLVLAGRAVHIGRYGRGGEDFRLTELFLGYPWLIRGYDDGSFTFAEATPDPDDPGATPLYAQLFGSKMAFANLELRLPLLGAFGIVPSAGVPPVEAHGFFDAGVAWTEDQQARFLGGPRRLLRSYGAGLRVNLLGIAIGQIDYVKPLDRPLKGAHWVFTLSPGF